MCVGIFYNTSTQTGEPPPKNPHNVTYRLHRMDATVSVLGVIKKFGNGYTKST